MNLEKFVSVAGLPGIHRLIAARSNGVVIMDTKEGRSRFVPTRGANFTPLGTIQMYVESESGLIALGEVFDRVFENREIAPMPEGEASSNVLRAWFKIVLPEHDEDRVHIADIKKLVKWYRYMDEKGMVAEAQKAEADAKTAAENGEEAEKTPVIEEKADVKPGDRAPKKVKK